MWATIIFMMLLAAIVLALLLWPLLRQERSKEAVSRAALNAAVYRDGLAELVRDRAAGTLSAAAFDQSALELHRRAKQEAGGGVGPAAALAGSIALPAQKPPRALAASLALLLPACAVALYLWLGTPRAVLETADPHRIDAAQVEVMVATLAARLKENPNDLKGWVMLARSYKALGRFELAADAYSHLGVAIDGEPDLLADYAEVLARQANGDFSGKPEELLARALHLDPDNEQALALAGIAAYHRQAYAEAVSYLEKLLPKLPPDSEGARTVKGTIEEARKLAGLTAGLPPRVAAKAPAAAGAAGLASALKGQVSLSPALAAAVKPDDTLFVYAKPVQGPRIPLAVLRTRAAALPLAFTLDDSLAMNPGMKLSSLAPGTEIQVGARISHSGEAMPRSGDPVGELNHIKPGTQDLKIVIDHAVP